MKFLAEQIAGLLEGELVGNPSAEVHTLAKIEEGAPGALSFLANPKYEEHIYSTQSSICIVNKTFQPSQDLPASLTLIKVEDAYACFAKLLEMYDSMTKQEARIESPSFIDETATVGEGLYLGAFAYIGKNCKIGDNVEIHPNANIGPNVEIGDGTVIYAGATIYRDCIIGKNCIIHSGAVIGADGFGFAPNEKGEFQKIPQIGNVVLEDSAQVGIAGSCKVGNNVLIGGQVGLAGHLKVGDRVKIAAQSGIPGDVKEDTTVMGSPAFESKEYKKAYMGFRRLPMILDRLKRLEDQLKSKTKDHS